MFISIVRTIAQRPNSARLAGTIRASTALSQAVLATPCSRSFSLASFLRQGLLTSYAQDCITSTAPSFFCAVVTAILGDLPPMRGSLDSFNNPMFNPITVFFGNDIASPTLTPASSSKDVVLEEQVPGFREPGQIPSNYEIASGLERYEYLKLLKGEDPWEDLQPIVLTEAGTMKKPIIVRGIDPERYVGCTGFPAESHEAVWLTVRPHGGVDRCPHCGNVFKHIITKKALSYDGLLRIQWRLTIDIGAGDAFLLNK
ncbi:hypothetical protein BSLG_010543 [Batrachochytrium salamandrivorans]|nr:hypothetical protein BSLG_010543 [Batrachochytrium salamandrivorans]